MSLPGAKQTAVQKAEQDLGISLPEDYKQLLLTQNKFEIGDWAFYPIKDEEFIKKTWDNIVRNNQELKELLPSGFVAIADNGTLNQLGYINAEGYVTNALYYWNHETKTLSLESFSLGDWIREIHQTEESRLEQFAKEVKASQIIYTLIDEKEGGLACAASAEEDTDVLLFWSNETTANQWTEEWKGYTILEISLSDFLKKWISGMQKDGLLCGVNWKRSISETESEPAKLNMWF
ncbi:DUF2750 domain-containing protein [Domibacillus sp. DTU_2020_1001157_1_SI_ALB_TIR_016]|uniref:DUF2750 domain-containing protein n=1 Tax=Domibacillus sp. DTU_2020_1001157_1_SI_ALB_TIR_016 TaxID=3077789 RepID=UPI0028E1F8BE|nr:DUF2750 domain-containing protein [Domibacillus sp. DTU_2020_1001157_1_SI_ALB_TIR_016]WNS80198.1 DUF2750 domain-containing protein [Domibacillus sp. DTU_2020_1001157_1_SI_ALB_TIR_016]